MTDCLTVAELVEVRLDCSGGNGEVFLQEAEEVWGVALGATVLDSEELDSVAGGEDKGFADSGLLCEGPCGVGEAGGWDGETFAELDGSGGVIDTDQYQRTIVGMRGRGFSSGSRRHDGEAL